MISYDPAGYGSASFKDNKFYKDFLSSMGISSVAALFSPMNVWFSMTVQANVAGGEAYLDMTNAQLGGVTQATFINYRYAYHGNLSLSIYCASNVAGLADIAISNIIIPRGAGGLDAYFFDMRRDVASDTIIDQSNLYQYESMGFKGLYLNVAGAGNAQYILNGVFTGVKISY